MANRITRFFREREEATPGILADDYRNLAWSSFAGSVALSLLSYKFGNLGSIISAETTGLASLVSLGVMRTIFDEVEDGRKKVIPPSEPKGHTSFIAPLIKDVAGGLTIAGMAELPSTYWAFHTHEHMPYMIGTVAGTIAAASVLTVSLFRENQPAAHNAEIAAPQVLTEGPISDTIA